MSFLDNLKKSIGGAADYTVKKTGEVTGTARIRMDIRACNARLAKCFESIGRTYYKEQKGLIENGTETIAASIAEADAIKAEIANLRTQLAALQGCVLCPSCSAQISDKSIFCPLCGVKLPTKNAEEPQPMEEDASPAAEPAEDDICMAEERSEAEEETSEEPKEE